MVLWIGDEKPVDMVVQPSPYTLSDRECYRITTQAVVDLERSRSRRLTGQWQLEGMSVLDYEMARG